MDDKFTFLISLSVLNHLGRQLYRSFATVLGEAISNAWDADAKNVWVDVDRNRNSFVIKDDGTGMTASDFQDKFLKIGYSKRKEGTKSPIRERPFIGRKGIGKLALLSCAKRIAVISKTKGGEYVGGVIDNSRLDKAITDDLTPQKYPLGQWSAKTFKRYMRAHSQGTIVYFEDTKEGIRNSADFLRKIIALYFRFSLLDKSFNIYLNNEKVTHEHLADLAASTEFLWKIGKYDDPYLEKLSTLFAENPTEHETKSLSFPGVHGFVASVAKPRDLKISTTEERVGIDLFVNGRLRESDILKHLHTERVADSYLYGQIHFDGLDDKKDRFTSSREGIVADDPKYSKFLRRFRRTILKVVEDWDAWRLKHRKDGDPENPRLSKRDRASLGLYGAVSREYGLPKGAKNRDKVEAWVDELSKDATFNFSSYAECFVAENLVRKYIKDQRVPMSPEAHKVASELKKREYESKNKGNISIEIRRAKGDISYLDMRDLSALVDKKDPAKEACLIRDASEYKPIRDAVAHTALLSDPAKNKLTTIGVNIQGRVKNLLAEKKGGP